MANDNNNGNGQKTNLNGDFSQSSSKKVSDLDVSGVSMKNLETGLWWVRNRGNLKKSLIVILIIICVGTVGYSLFNFGYYLIKGMWDDKKMVTDMVNTTTVSPDFLAQRAAQNLSLSPVGMIEGDGVYDIYISIRNPNPKHWGTFSYCFMSGEKELQCGNDFILPGEKKFVMALGTKSAVRPSNVKFSLNKIDWKKLNPHIIPDWEKYKNEHLQIELKDVSFKPAGLSDLSEKIGLNTLSFSITNSSAYGFWDAPLSIVLYRSNRIVGISRYSLKELSSYDAKTVQITWPGDLSGVNDIDIVPDINIMDIGNYLEPGR